MSMVRTEPEEYVAIGWRGVEALRELLLAAGRFWAGEFISTTDQDRVWLLNDDATAMTLFSQGVWHGEVADEAAMLALNSTSARGCWYGDKCKRADLGGAVYECVIGNGDEAAQWIAVASGAESLATSGRWEPVTNGDPEDTQLVFDGAGDIVMGFVID